MADPAYDYTVGSVATLTLTATPGDGTTTGSVLLTSPTGATSSPAVSGSVSGGVWTGTAHLAVTAAGVWDARWTVTGTGAGVRQQRITVGPLVPQAGRSYATTADLASWLEDDPPTNAGKLLRDATREIDNLLRCAVYAVDGDGMPTDPDVIAAVRDAACAQVEWWTETGDPLGARAVYRSVSIGSVSLSRATGTGNPTGSAARISRVAVDILRNAGLVGGSPWAW